MHLQFGFQQIPKKPIWRRCQITGQIHKGQRILKHEDKEKCQGNMSITNRRAEQMVRARVYRNHLN